MKLNLYKWLWTKIGGRPWTYIMRDFYHEVEYVVLLGMFSLGFFAHCWLDIKEFLTIITSVTAGYILGHLFWGRKWLPGQGGK